MNFIKARIEDGTYKPHELLPPIQQLADQTGHSRHTLSKALRILQDQGLVDRTPGLGYVARTTTASAHVSPVTDASGHTGSPAGRRQDGHLRPVTAASGHTGSPAGWGQGGGTYAGR